MLSISTIAAFAATVIFVASLRPVATSMGIVDRPGGRKRHGQEVPIIGGVAMYFGLVVALSISPGMFPGVLQLLVAGGLLVFIGVLDDRFALPTGVRFLTQLLVVIVMVYGTGLRMMDIGDPFGFGTIMLGSASFLVTVLITSSVINAYNMLDGLDGLAGTLALIPLASITLVAGLEVSMAGLALIVIAIIVAFLLFNFPSPWSRGVRTFMGDAGSMLIGMLVAWIVMSLSQGEGAVASPVVCLWFAALPIYDLFTRFAVRIARGYSPLRPARDHFHHTLIHAGMSVRLVLGIMTGLQLLYAAIGYLGHTLGAPDVVMFTAWSVTGFSQQWLFNKMAAYHRLAIRRRRREGPKPA